MKYYLVDNYTKILFLLLILIFAVVPAKAQSILESFDFSKSETFLLPNQLKEVSGLALNSEGRLFAHNDEKGTVYEIDFNNKKIIKFFFIGWRAVYRDFEDIAIVDDKFYLLVSNGDIYEFSEADHKRYSDYTIYRSAFSSKFEFEGLCYDSLTNSLLLASKEYPGKKYSGMRTVYSFNLITKQFIPEPRFVISLKELKSKYKISEFKPTGIEYHPLSETFFIISSNKQSIIELSNNGEIINGMLLPEANHQQPEGITFNKLGDLLIADEGKNGRGFITKYKIVSIPSTNLDEE